MHTLSKQKPLREKMPREKFQEIGFTSLRQKYCEESIRKAKNTRAKNAWYLDFKNSMSRCNYILDQANYNLCQDCKELAVAYS